MNSLNLGCEANIGVEIDQMSVEFLRYGSGYNGAKAIAATTLEVASLGITTLITNQFDTHLRKAQNCLFSCENIQIPTGNIQVIGPSGDGKTQFIRGLKALRSKRYLYRWGHSVMRTRGKIRFHSGIQLEDEGGQEVSSLSYSDLGVGTRFKINQGGSIADFDSSGQTFEYTIFIANKTIKAIQRTEIFFDQDTGNDLIESFKDKARRSFLKT